MDHFSPLAPSFIRALILPVGQIQRSTFLNVLEGLQNKCSVVPLSGLNTIDGDSLLAPGKQPRGSLFYNFTASAAPEQQHQLSPFEIWRDTLLVLGVVSISNQSSVQRVAIIKHALDQLRERYGRVVHRHVLVLHDPSEVEHGMNQDAVTFVAEDEDLSGGLIPAIRAISVGLLHDLTTYAQAMQASPNIQTPGQASQGLLRSMLPRDEERPRSHHSTPMEPRSPAGDDSDSRPTSKEFASPPATNFDQIALANTLARSDSRGSKRSKSRPRKDSLDRVPVHALSKEKIKDRGKARVGVVLGSIYLLAGQWTEALKVLIDNTTRLRALSDHIWHAKGLEYSFVCLLLHLWAGIDYSVPPICYQLSDKVRDRLSKAIVAEIQQRVTSQQTPAEKLSTSTPDLLKHILVLYHATESSLELPYTTVAEATIRFCKALANLYTIGGIFGAQDVDQMLGVRGSGVETRSAVVSHEKNASLPLSKLNKAIIADLLSHALPVHEEKIKVTEHINILTGVASVYSTLGLHRKKIILLRSVVQRLVTSMEQARKLSAAELGIHPATTLSIENGPDALLSTIHGSSGLLGLAQTIVAVFGVQLADPYAAEHTPSSQTPHFGSNVLRSEILRDLLKLCEASPDLCGISALVTASMSNIARRHVIDTSISRHAVSTSPEEQTRRLGMMNRSHWLSKQLGLPEILSDFWDPYLVRSITFKPLKQELLLLDNTSSDPHAAHGGPAKPNPLLYDPHAPKKESGNATQLLVVGETATCQITLQNALDTSIDIESIELMVDGDTLAGRIVDVRLGPARLQQFCFEILPRIVGTADITGCRIKIPGCHQKDFNLTGLNSVPATINTMKSFGQEVLNSPQQPDTAEVSIATSKVVVKVLEPQSVLEIDGRVEPSSTLMLLAGEIAQFKLKVWNHNKIPATIQKVNCTDGVVLVEHDRTKEVVEPSRHATLSFDLTAERSLTQAAVNIVYGTSVDSSFSRSVTTKLELTVHPGLQVSWVDAKPYKDDAFALVVDLYNSWHQPLEVTGECNEPDGWKRRTESQSLAAGQIRRLHINIKRWSSDVRDCADAQKCAAELQKHFRIVWAGTQRQGRLFLQAPVLINEVVEAICGPVFSINLKPSDEQDRSADDTAVVKSGSFFNITAVVENRSGSDSGPLHLQLHCTTHGIAPTSPRHGIGVAGSMQRLVHSTRASEKTTVQFALCPLSSGVLEIGAILRAALPSAITSKESITEHRLRIRVVG